MSVPKDLLLSERRLWADLFEVWNTTDTEEAKTKKMMAIRIAYDEQHGEEASAKALGTFTPAWKRPTVQEHLDGGANDTFRENIRYLARNVYLRAALVEPNVAEEYIAVLEGGTEELTAFIAARTKPYYGAFERAAMETLGAENDSSRKESDEPNC
jgi:hypothetical protein